MRRPRRRACSQVELRECRSSVARRLGFARQGPAVPRNLVIGEYRSSDDPMQIVSGPHGREIVHYQAVAGAAVRAEMHAFLEWFNRTADLDGLLRAGLAHVWFESIHPFDDGNGRIGRAVVDIALAQDARRSSRLLGISSAMRQRQAAYYDALNVAQRGDGDVTPWLEWFLDTYTEACRTSAELIDEALARARFWTDHRAVPLNEMQRRVLGRMLDAGPGRFDGGLTARKYTAIAGTTRVTASRHLADLLEKGLIVRAAGTERTLDSLRPRASWMGVAAADEATRGGGVIGRLTRDCFTPLCVVRRSRVRRAPTAAATRPQAAGQARTLRPDRSSGPAG